MQIKKWLKKTLQGKAGDSLVEFVGSLALQLGIVMILLLCLVFMANALKLFFACNKVSRSIEVSGIVDARTYEMVEELLGDSLHVTTTVDAHYYDAATGKIQLRDKFTVTLSAVYSIPLVMPLTHGTPVTLDIPLRISMIGISEVYWR